MFKDIGGHSNQEGEYIRGNGDGATSEGSGGEAVKTQFLLSLGLEFMRKDQEGRRLRM